MQLKKSKSPKKNEVKREINTDARLENWNDFFRIRQTIALIFCIIFCCLNVHFWWKWWMNSKPIKIFKAYYQKNIVRARHFFMCVCDTCIDICRWIYELLSVNLCPCFSGAEDIATASSYSQRIFNGFHIYNTLSFFFFVMEQTIIIFCRWMVYLSI